MLYGFSGVILQGALVTLELAISSVVLAVIIGLIGAGGKLSQNRLSGLIFEGYTTLIRGVPDLVLMLLIFYGLQIALNTVTEAMGVGQIDIDPMVAGIITLGFSRKLMQRRKVLLPDPDDPMMLMTSPAFACNETPFSTSCSP